MNSMIHYPDGPSHPRNPLGRYIHPRKNNSGRNRSKVSSFYHHIIGSKHWTFVWTKITSEEVLYSLKMSQNWILFTIKHAFGSILKFKCAYGNNKTQHEYNQVLNRNKGIASWQLSGTRWLKCSSVLVPGHMVR